MSTQGPLAKALGLITKIDKSNPWQDNYSNSKLAISVLTGCVSWLQYEYYPLVNAANGAWSLTAEKIKRSDVDTAGNSLIRGSNTLFILAPLISMAGFGRRHTF